MTRYRQRPVQEDDAERLLALQHAQQIAVIGRPDCTLDDIRDQLLDPDLDPRSPVVLDADGHAVGVAMVFPAGDTDSVELDVVVHPDVNDALLRPVLEQAVELAADAARARGHAEVKVDQGCYRQDAALAEMLRGLGFTPGTTFHRMRRELPDAVEVRVPHGVRIERIDVETDRDLRRAHALHMSTFEGHFGFHRRPYEEWLESRAARTGLGPLWLAVADGTDVGFLQETSQFVEDEDAGYVWQLGVASQARGRGIAKALLLTSFAAMRERGRSAALLHVDTANATGATRLYESVGMRPGVVIDVWRCVRDLR